MKLPDAITGCCIKLSDLFVIPGGLRNIFTSVWLVHACSCAQQKAYGLIVCEQAGLTGLYLILKICHTLDTQVPLVVERTYSRAHK